MTSPRRDDSGRAARPDRLLLRGSVHGSPVAELALSHALLDRVAAGGLPGVARLYRPAAALAFGRVDTLRPGFSAAVRTAEAHGFGPVVRAPGGRAAAYHDRSVVLELADPSSDARAEIERRFASMAELVVTALRDLGVKAEAGELPGEYCPGRFSVLAGGVKLGGIAQRVVRGASLTSIAIVVEDGGRIRTVLEAISADLGYPFDPATAGAVADVAPGITTAVVAAAIEEALAARSALVGVEPDQALLAAAAAREADHRVPATSGSRVATGGRAVHPGAVHPEPT